MTQDFAVAPDVALQEFERFCEAMDIDFEYHAEAEGFEDIRKRILLAIQRGTLIINDDGEAIYTPNHRKSTYKEPLHFHERSGATAIAMDGVGKRKMGDVAKSYAMMAELCRVDPSVFVKLIGTDLKTCEALGVLLMQG